MIRLHRLCEWRRGTRRWTVTVSVRGRWYLGRVDDPATHLRPGLTLWALGPLQLWRLTYRTGGWR